MTTSGDARVLNTDVALLAVSVQPVWPQITQKYIGSGGTGTPIDGR